MSCILTATSRQRTHFIKDNGPQGTGVTRPWGCRREGPGPGSQVRAHGLQGAAWLAEVARGRGLPAYLTTEPRMLPGPPGTHSPCIRAGGSMRRGCRGLSAELSMAASSSPCVVPPPTPWQRALKEQARPGGGGNSPTLPELAVGPLRPEGEHRAFTQYSPPCSSACHRGHPWSG